MWIAIVPAIVRTEPEPTPNSSIASSAALAQPRMRRQAEVVVRRQVDAERPSTTRVRPLLVVEHAQLAVEALALEGVELGSEIGQRIERD